MTLSRTLARLAARAAVAGLRLAVRLPEPWIARGLRNASRLARSLSAPATLHSDLDDLARAFAEHPRQAALVRRVLLESHPGELEDLAEGALPFRRRALDPTALVATAVGRAAAPGRAPGALPGVHAVDALLAAEAVGRVNGIRIGVLLGAGTRLEVGPVGWLEPLALALRWLGPITELDGSRPVARDGRIAPVVLRWRHARPGCLGVLDLTHAPGLSMARGERELRVEVTGTDGLILLEAPDGSTGAEPSLHLYRGPERLDLSAPAGLFPVEPARPPDGPRPLDRELQALIDRLDPPRPR